MTRSTIRCFSAKDGGDKGKDGSTSTPPPSEPPADDADADLEDLLKETDKQKAAEGAKGSKKAGTEDGKKKGEGEEEGGEGEGKEEGEAEADLTMPYAAIAAAVAAAVGSLSFVGYWLYTKRALLDALAMSRMDLGYVIFTAYKKSLDILKAEPAVTTKLGGKNLVAEESTLKMHQTEDTASALFALFGPRGRASVDLFLRAVPDSSFNQWAVEQITVDLLNGEVVEIDLVERKVIVADKRGYRELEYGGEVGGGGGR
jgi:hypothetical protein